ncbi:hypothetical protein SKAU_G00117770 [Synaphobranchus kaupii]|uniref:Complement C3/4/5 macroglobulin domain-containing protein n=1 Tax=Synaphobranchus kaupii TaxID=118154 RepID=A0A9Q1J1Q9_SYNKA|nr:hypothetical protein SKAU_G00117770 [Synaphobranchus kaupii]
MWLLKLQIMLYNFKNYNYATRLVLQELRFVLTAPNVLRVGSRENVLVEAQECTGEHFDVEILATIVVFQAVAMHMTKVSDVKDVNLQVNLDVAGRSKPIKWTYTKNNAYLTRSEKVGLLSGSEEHDGLWLVVALAGVDGRGYTLSDCFKHLVVAPAIAPFSKGFWAAAKEVF